MIDGINFLHFNWKEKDFSIIVKKKICIFAGYFNNYPFGHGGAEYQAYLLAEALDKKKFDTFIYTNILSKQEYNIEKILLF